MIEEDSWVVIYRFLESIWLCDHHNLHEQLEVIGITTDIYELVENYVTNRKKFTEIHCSRSDSKGISQAFSFDAGDCPLHPPCRMIYKGS